MNFCISANLKAFNPEIDIRHNMLSPVLWKETKIMKRLIHQKDPDKKTARNWSISKLQAWKQQKGWNWEGRGDLSAEIDLLHVKWNGIVRFCHGRSSVYVEAPELQRLLLYELCVCLGRDQEIMKCRRGDWNGWYMKRFALSHSDSPVSLCELTNLNASNFSLRLTTTDASFCFCTPNSIYEFTLDQDDVVLIRRCTPFWSRFARKRRRSVCALPTSS